MDGRRCIWIFRIKTKNILIVDDINDTGATFNWIVNDWQDNCLLNDTHWRNVWCENVRFAVLTDNQQVTLRKGICRLEVNKAEKDVWLVYPGERKCICVMI